MKRATYRFLPRKKAKLTPAVKTFLDELRVHGELSIFAERSVEAVVPAECLLLDPGVVRM